MASGIVTKLETKRLESRGIFDAQFGLYESRLELGQSTAYILSYASPLHTGSTELLRRINSFLLLVHANDAKIARYEVAAVLYNTKEFGRIGIREKLAVFAGDDLQVGNRLRCIKTMHYRGRVRDDIDRLIEDNFMPNLLRV